MTFPLKTRLLTTEEYQQMAEMGILTQEDKVELIEGQIVEMSPIGSQHATYVNKITALFIRLLPEEFITSIQNPIVINLHSEPEPDIAILKPDKNLYIDQLPTAKDVLLIIEVADTSIDYDREVKLPLYAKANIPEYWIINLQEKQIEVYHTPVEKQYRFRELIKAEDELQFLALNLNIPARSILS
jgi:Uma2 family endonuclease